MSQHYLSYWRPETAKYLLDSAPRLLEHAASAQYGKVRRGDVIWLCTAWPGGVLTLLGPISVAAVVSQEEAERRLGPDLWEAPFHILADHATAAPIREVDCSDIAGSLRFASDKDRLSVRNGRVNAKQLQAMRELTPYSAELLHRRWTEDLDLLSAATSIIDDTNGRAGFGDAVTNKAVETAGVEWVTQQLTGEGWTVTSVESLRVGYDLKCTRDDQEMHAEVKATRSTWPSFMITEGELQRAESDAALVLFVLTGALSEQPELFRFTGNELLEAYDFQPLTYRAATKSSDRVNAAKYTG